MPNWLALEGITISYLPELISLSQNTEVLTRNILDNGNEAADFTISNIWFSAILYILKLYSVLVLNQCYAI